MERHVESSVRSSRMLKMRPSVLMPIRITVTVYQITETREFFFQVDCAQSLGARHSTQPSAHLQLSEFSGQAWEQMRE